MSDQLDELFAELDEELHVIADMGKPRPAVTCTPAIPHDDREKCIASFNGKAGVLSIILKDKDASHLILERA